MIEKEIKIGEEQYFENNICVETSYSNPFEVNKNPGRAAIAEARHVVLKPDNVTGVKIDTGGGGVTNIASFDHIQAAAHKGDGDDHDRFITESMGHDYEGAASIANGILKSRQEDVIYLAGYIERKKSISGHEARQAIKRSRSGETVNIKIKNPDGEIKKEVKTGVKGEVVIVNFSEFSQKEL